MIYIIYILFMFLSIGLALLIKLSQPVFWALIRLRLIYPIITVVVYLFLTAHPDWKITQFVRYELFPSNNLQVIDFILAIVIILSALALSEELIQMIFPDFTWIGVIVFLCTIPSRLRNRKILREERAEQQRQAEIERKNRNL